MIQKQASKQAVQVATKSIVGYYAHKMRSLNYTFPVGSRTLLAALISTHPDCKIARTVSKCPFTAATWRIVRPFWGANIQIRYRSQFTGPPKKIKTLSVAVAIPVDDPPPSFKSRTTSFVLPFLACTISSLTRVESAFLAESCSSSPGLHRGESAGVSTQLAIVSRAQIRILGDDCIQKR